MKRRPKGTGTIEKTRDDRFRARLSFKPGVREDIEGSPFLTYEEAERALDALLFELRSLGATRGTPLARVVERMFAQRHAAGYSAVNGEESREAVLDLAIGAQEAAS